MAQIKIYGDVVKGCIFFDGSTVEPKFLGTILAEVKADETDRIVIYRTDRRDSIGNNRELFKRLNSNRVQNEAGEDLVNALGYDAQQVADYINGQSNLTASVNPVVDTSLNDIDVNFKLDATNTSIIFDNGYQYGVNTIKAVDTGDGLITIKSIEDARILFTELDHTKVDVNGSDVAGGLNDVINVLNELFTVGAFESVVISDPYATMVADTTGVVTTETDVTRGDAIEIQPDEYGATVSGYNKGGYITPEVINQAGEYFTFDVRNEGIIGFGLVVSDDDFSNGKFNGVSAYADPSGFCSPSVANSGNYGYQFSHWFHPSPNGPWTNYGANTGYSMREGWNSVGSKFNGSEEGAKWLNGDVIRMRVGINENNFIVISYFDESTSLYIPIARTNYAVPNGNDFHLGIKFGDSTVRLVGLPRVHLLATDFEDPAPIMYFRYIESGDGVFNYPLFATEEEANYYHKVIAGVSTGTSMTHTYADDPTNTVWYMPTNGQMAGTGAPYNMVFDGQTVLFTEITSLTDSDLTPSAFSASDITQEEGTNVNIQVTPAGAVWSSSVTITPSGSGLVYDGYSLIQGTLADVGSDTTYTVEVTRANSYGSSVGSMTVTATDVAPVQTNGTAWTKALDFSGSNEYAKLVSSHNLNSALKMQGMGIAAGAPVTAGYTSNHSNARAWATSIVFKIDGNSSNQHIWNSGEGNSSGNDNIYLRTDSNRNLYFAWGRDSQNSTSQKNECKIANAISTSEWYGVYISSTGERLSSGNATATNLADCFDIRLMSSSDSFASVGSNLSISTNWLETGSSMTNSVIGDFTIGGRSNNRNFHGKVASMVVTTLKNNQLMPTDAEIKDMISDPVGWVTDFKLGSTFMSTGQSSGGSMQFPYSVPTTNYAAIRSTQVWLMGDGASDSYANGIRSYIYPSDQNNVKLQLNSMVSNDIQSVNINGLT